MTIIKPIKDFFFRINLQFRQNLNGFLENTHDHYACYFPGDIGFLPSLILKLFFSGITVSKEHTHIIEKLPRDALLIFASKHKSYFEFIFYHTRYRHENRPFPEIGLGYKILLMQPLSRILRILTAGMDHFIHHFSLPNPYKRGYIKQELINGRSASLFLVEKKDFYQRFIKSKTDPIEHLIELQNATDRPIYIIPQLMFFGNTPVRSTTSLTDVLFGSANNPGRLRRLVTLFKSPDKVFVEISDPLNLKHFLFKEENQYKDNKQLSLLLRRDLLIQMNRHRQSITGPVLKSTEEIKQNILTNESLQHFMLDHAGKKNVPLFKVHKRADSYIDEIAAKYNIGMIKILSVIVKLFLDIMFEGVTVNNEVLTKIKGLSKNGPLILIPCHKSHIDYLILSYLLYNNNMPCPHIAAGKNLSFWPLGPIFRRCGAFFIRRSFKGAMLYSKIFGEYIYKLLEEGFNIEFFIEGGRSRTGKLLMPKLGLLSILLDTYKNGACDDLLFTPIFIGYDRVLEESSYLEEIEGGQKKSENLSQVIQARKFLKKRYGRIYIKFHEPISLKEYLAKNRLTIHEMSSDDINILSRDLGNRFVNAIDQVSVITPYALVAGSILNSLKKKFSYDDLMEYIETYLAYLFSQGATLTDTLIFSHTQAVEQVIETYVNRKFIEPIALGKENHPSDKIFTTNENQRPNLEYYKNNCIAFFVPAAFTSIAILEKDAFQFASADLASSYSFLQNLFQNEFAPDSNRLPEYFIRKNIKAFIDDAILMPHPTLPDTYNLTSSGFRKLKLFSNFLKPYFESYRVVIRYFQQNTKNSDDPKARKKKIEATGSRMYKNNEIELKEALSSINYKNAEKFFITQGINGSNSNGKIDFYSDELKRYMSYLPP